jgi:hypothetical protein
VYSSSAAREAPRFVDRSWASTAESAKRRIPSASSGRSAFANDLAAATASAAAFFMLPLWSMTMRMDTGVVASWNVSMVCATPSSTTVRSSRDTGR